MLTSSSATNSSYSSSVSSSDPHLPYQYPQPMSTLSLGSQHPRRNPMSAKYPRYYSSPVDDGSETPLQIYGYEQREPSIYEKPKLMRRVSHALGNIQEDFSLQLDARSTANKIKRRSTLMLDGNMMAPRPETADSPMPPRSRPMSIMSASLPQRGLSRRLSRRLSIFSGRSKSSMGSKSASISSPNLIGSSTQYEERNQASFI
ncbi:hypothetical protein N7462_002149 [Penicillium macrosclerotiorum]|uniref:uncharacterized protein n=1 Tax=Penicillium macrosclerotiorum TaxID=303699 RepID=UPI002547F507|nr:uncharacterized protein N7462_002149 [Penicillium macrosclerotiorum]KAJ5692726.1 hypothetical protein N7462_002149 [Penicillium macrosclerotiorum]